MSGFELKEWINAAPNTVFEALINTQIVSQVNPNIKEMEKLTDGAVQVGTRFRETRIIDGKEAQTELTVMSCDSPTTYAVSAEQSGITVLYTYTLNPENDGTNIQLKCDISSGGVKKLMLPLVASIMKREDGNHLAQLKTVIEG